MKRLSYGDSVAKLTVARLFEVSQIATTKAYQDLETFVDYVNSLADNLVRILVNGVSLKDNVDCQIVKLNLKDNTPQSIATTKQPIEVRVQRQIPMTPAITAFTWQIDNTGALQVLVKFDTPPTTTVEVTLIAHFS